MLNLDSTDFVLDYYRTLKASKYRRSTQDCINQILIVGAGSVGALIGLALVKAGFNVTFAGRSNSNYTERIRRSGLTISYPSGKKFFISPLLPNVRFVDTQQQLKEKFDLIVVAVKSNYLSSVSSYINSHSDSHTILLHAQNGIPYWWFNEEKYLSSLDSTLANQIGPRPYLDSIDPRGSILKELSDRCLVGCVVKAPCSKTADGCIEVRKPPKMILGLTNINKYSFQEQKIKQLCQVFSAYGVETTYADNIRAEVCNKLAINVTTNVLSALTGCLISELTSNVYANNLIKTILREINQVFQAYGIRNSDLPTEKKIYSYISQPGSQRHLPSLAQDFSHHRRGEVSLIAAPVEMAKIADIDVPTLSSLAELLKLGQIYTLKSRDRKFAILAFNNDVGFYILREKIEDRIDCQQAQVPYISDYMTRINQSARRKILSLV